MEGVAAVAAVAAVRHPGVTAVHRSSVVTGRRQEKLLLQQLWCL